VKLWVAFLALAACVAIASAPALGGGWVYDDRLMLGHPMLDGLEDVAPAFSRTSADYQARTVDGPGIAGGSTYRPLAVVSVILVNGTVGPRPLAHHLVSLACHLGVLFLVLRFAARAGRVGWPALFVGAVIALHPAGVEAYGWINGRSDVLAGLFLAGILMLDGRPRSWPLLLVLLLAGGLCKETFFVAAAGLLVARRLEPWQPRPLAGDLGVLLVAGLSVLALRGSAGATLASVPTAGLIERIPRIVGLAVETWVAPWPRAMRLLAWETSRPAPLGELLAAALPLLAMLLLLLRREVRRAALVATALVALAPVALVGDSFWLGFDRYLYLPGILLAAAAIPLPGRDRIFALATVVAVLGLGAATFVAARSYGSHSAFAASLLADRPDDPTGYIFVADDALVNRRPDVAAAVLGQIPDVELPASVAHQTARLLLRAGKGAQAAALIEKTAAALPGDANLRFDLLTVRAAQRRWPEVIELARSIAGDPARRKAVADLVDGWAREGQIPPDVRAALQGLR